jgi:hypothetical protein
LILNSGIGDSDALVDKWQVGALVNQFNEKHYLEIIDKIGTLVRDPDVRKKTRRVATELFDLRSVGGERYASLYERVLG